MEGSFDFLGNFTFWRLDRYFAAGFELDTLRLDPCNGLIGLRLVPLVEMLFENTLQYGEG
ncbi:hypothetical protein F4775DRAFT_597934 [Biscogniauxia sp. FL1348]|nr:hypothetical protein F4775DRAFT_597933 [Biscogniauxia sp. FL1348]KAI0592721.1 hypothetical protein F4775DRAFT_597934 [Biscogniauxia sp. FL1348]